MDTDLTLEQCLRALKENNPGVIDFQSARQNSLKVLAKTIQRAKDAGLDKNEVAEILEKSLSK